MATRIESGQIQLRGVGTAPIEAPRPTGVEYVAPRVEAQGVSAISAALDKIGNILYREAAEFQTQAGMQYAAQNPPSIEQINAAKNGDTSGLVSGPAFSVYDQAVKKARSFQLAGEFEQEVRGKAAELIVKAENGLVTSEQVQRELNAMTDGFSKSLASVDGEAALKFRATSAAHGYTAVASAYKYEVQKAKELSLLKISEDYKNGQVLLRREIENGSYIDPQTQTPITLQQRIDLERQSFIKRAYAMGGLQAAQVYEKRFNEDLFATMSEVISTAAGKGELGATQEQILKSINQNGMIVTTTPDGQTKAVTGKYSEILMALTPAQKSAMRTEIRRIENEKEAARKDDQAVILEQDQRNAAQLESDYMRFGRPADLNKLRAIAIANPKAVSISHVEKLTKAREDAAPRNFLGEMRVRDEINNGMVRNLSELQDSMSRNGVSIRQGVDLYNAIDPARRREEQGVERVARGVAKLVPGSMNISARQQEEFYKFLDKARIEHDTAVKKWEADGRKGLRPQLDDVAEKLVNKRRQSKQSDRIENNIKYLNDTYGPKLGVRFDEMTDMSQDLRDAMVKNKFTKQQQEDVESYINGIKKNLDDLNQIRLD